MKVDLDKLWSTVQASGEHLTAEDRRNLAGLLQPNGLLSKALQEAWCASDGIKEAVLKLNFADPTAAVRAANMQGRLQGMAALLEALVETANLAQETTDEAA